MRCGVFLGARGTQSRFWERFPQKKLNFWTSFFATMPQMHLSAFRHKKVKQRGADVAARNGTEMVSFGTFEDPPRRAPQIELLSIDWHFLHQKRATEAFTEKT